MAPIRNNFSMYGMRQKPASCVPKVATVIIFYALLRRVEELQKFRLHGLISYGRKPICTQNEQIR
jgi:hypothetical protein